MPAYSVSFPERARRVDTQDFLFVLLAILFTARVLAELSARFGAPPVIGELTAGILLGPSLLGWLSPGETLRALAEIGIILLLFQVGLETDVRRLARTGLQSALLALVGFLLPMVLGFVAVYGLFGLPLLVALFVGGTLTATSIGITVRVLSDLGRQQTTEGQIVLGAAVIDDVLGVVLLALLYEFSVGGGVSLANTAKVLLYVGAFFILAPVAAKLMSGVVHRMESQTQIPGLIPTAIVSLVLFFAWLAHAMGAPELLGGFAAGLALSRRFFLPFGLALRTDAHFAARIERQMQPIIQLFAPIFFVVVGLSLNLRAVDWGSWEIWLLSGVLLAAAVVGKVIGALALRGVPLATRWVVGTAMVPRGEVGLIFAEIGIQTGVFDDLLYASLVIVIALTTLIPPFVMKAMIRRQDLADGITSRRGSST